MKNLKRLTLTAIVLIAIGFSGVKAQDDPKTVMMFVYDEMKGTSFLLTLIVTTPDGENYEVPMQELSVKSRKESNIANYKIIQSEINKWKKEGFKIDNLEGGNGVVGITIVMSKD